MTKAEVDDPLEELVREHETRTRLLGVLVVPVLLILPSVGSDTLTVPITQQHPPFPCVKISAADESCFRPEADHPAHGEGSGELPTLVGIGAASGTFTNTTSAVLTTPSWGPPSGNGQFQGPPAAHLLHVAPITPRFPFLPRARRFC
jgi:hypothetical protein